MTHNPITEYLSRYPNENKTTLAKKAGVGYSIVHRTDLALYDDLPPKLENFFNEHMGVPPSTSWRIEYRKYKTNCLESHRRSNRNALWVKKPAHSYNTWIDFREYVDDSQMGFSKLFLINPAILSHYETRITKNLPEVIRQRLRYFGMPAAEVQKLSELPVGRRSSPFI
ncbi:hypothetical protein NELLIE_3 [Arthrobacter phage Nellie]|uniref:Uncharacterized protein n=2 Tax=Jasminevirus adat TaxID=2560299 RepID=A0A249XLG3_9CAUD|nr:hypothetical protein FDI47_gp03 [Arthrobacter phage Adat]ASZ72576.1 hypothetical protein ADAT_3 [Arthrobacter phage Adat]ASZ73722.1 hypothetical protein NELLIE_3 [Arthrobacter phage Nellie]